MKPTVLEATLLLQRRIRAYRSARIFLLIRQIIADLRTCDQNYLMKAIGFDIFEHEPIEVVFKLHGAQFPPTLLFSVRLLDATNVNLENSALDLPECIAAQSKPFVFKPPKFKPLMSPAQSTTPEVFTRVSPYDLAGVIEISSRKFAQQRRRTYRERQAEMLKRMLGLDRFEQSVETQNDYFIASQASDLSEFIKLLDQPQIGDLEQNALIDAHFGVQEDQTDLNRILALLPAGQFF